MRPPGVAAQQPPERQPRAFERPVHPDRLDPVVAACRVMPANPVPAARHPQPRRDGELVEADQLGEQPGHAEPSTFNPQDSTSKEESYRVFPILLRIVATRSEIQWLNAPRNLPMRVESIDQTQ